MRDLMVDDSALWMMRNTVKRDAGPLAEHSISIDYCFAQVPPLWCVIPGAIGLAFTTLAISLPFVFWRRAKAGLLLAQPARQSAPLQTTQVLASFVFVPTVLSLQWVEVNPRKATGAGGILVAGAGLEPATSWL